MKLFGRREPTRIKWKLQKEGGTSKVPTDMDANLTGASSINNRSMKELRTMLLNSPLVFAGITKKSKDLIYSWFEWEKGTPVHIKETTKNWKQVIMTVLQEAIFHAEWSGDGYIEKLYDPKKDTGDSETSPPKGEKPINLRVIDPMTIVDIKDDFLVLRGYVKGRLMKRLKTVKVHPDRYFKYTPRPLADAKRGISALDVAFNVALSMLNADTAHGEYLYRTANGFMVLTIQQGNQTEVDEGIKYLKKIQSGFVGTERHEFDIKNPTKFEPREFNFYFYRALAAVIEMPVSMFIGQNTGDVDIRDDRAEYYSRIAATQKVHVAPLIKKILAEVMGLKNPIVHNMLWLPVYVDPRAQGEKARYMASAVRMLSQAILDNPDFVTVDEARAIVGLPPRDPAEKPQEPVSPDMSSSPEDPEQHISLEMNDEIIETVTELDEYVIEHIKKLAEEERKLGKRILEEQEQNEHATGSIVHDARNRSG